MKFNKVSLPTAETHFSRLTHTGLWEDAQVDFRAGRGPSVNLTL